jgi:hypothetical protein
MLPPEPQFPNIGFGSAACQNWKMFPYPANDQQKYKVEQTGSNPISKRKFTATCQERTVRKMEDQKKDTPVVRRISDMIKRMKRRKGYRNNQK